MTEKEVLVIFTDGSSREFKSLRVEANGILTYNKTESTGKIQDYFIPYTSIKMITWEEPENK